MSITFVLYILLFVDFSNTYIFFGYLGTWVLVKKKLIISINKKIVLVPSLLFKIGYLTFFLGTFYQKGTQLCFKVPGFNLLKLNFRVPLMFIF